MTNVGLCLYLQWHKRDNNGFDAFIRDLAYTVGLGRCAFQVATERKTPSAAQQRHRHWISDAAG